MNPIYNSLYANYVENNDIELKCKDTCIIILVAAQKIALI